MIRKIFTFGILLGLTMGNAFATLADYCVLNSNGICYWCDANSSMTANRGGYCNGSYPGCTSGEQSVSRGGTASGAAQGLGTTGTFKCTVDGFCMQSCSATRWYNVGDGLMIYQTASGCKCDEWTSTSQYRCANGYYESENSSNGCARCPSVKNAAGETVYGYSMPGVNLSIEDCVLMDSDGPYVDDTGEFDLTDMCHYVKD